MSKRLTLMLILATVGAMVFAMSGRAQGGSLTGRGGAMQARSHVPFRAVRQGGSLTGPRTRRFSTRSRSANVPYLYPPYYYSDYYSEPAPSEATPSRVVVVENSQPRAQAPPAPPPESLVLERQGNHWVRITDSGQTRVNSQPQQQGPAKASTLRSMTPQQNAALEPPREVPPAMLVFRDGHKEEITRYTIVGGTIYANADYWNNGSWTKKVPIAELNVPATLELNRECGANFSLPSGPGVIVVRP